MTRPLIRRTRDRAATTALFLANGFGFGIWAGNVPRLREAQGLTDSGLGLLLLAISGGAVAAMPLAGWLAARTGAARLAACAGIAAALMICLPALVHGWPALIAVGIALGMSLGAMDVAMNGHATSVERAWRAPLMSSFHAGWSFGGLAGSAVAGALAAAGMPLSLSYGVPALLVALLALAGFSQPDTRLATADPRFALPGRVMAGVALLAGLSFVAEGAVADWSGVYLRSVLGTDAARAASAYAFYSLAMAAGRLGGDTIERRAGAAAVVRLGGGLAALGFALLLATPDPLAADAALVMIGFGLSNMVPIAFSAAGRLAGTAGIAMTATTGYAGFMASPPLVGMAADVVGLRAALLMILAGVIAMVFLGRTVARSA